MVEASVLYTFLIKTMPYVVGLKVVGGAIDVTTHYIKLRITKSQKVRER